MLEICRDIEKLCPKAILLNYTNPMAMLCKAMQVATDVNVVGTRPPDLCRVEPRRNRDYGRGDVCGESKLAPPVPVSLILA